MSDIQDRATDSKTPVPYRDPPFSRLVYRMANEVGEGMTGTLFQVPQSLVPYSIIWYPLEL